MCECVVRLVRVNAWSVPTCVYMGVCSYVPLLFENASNTRYLHTAYNIQTSALANNVNYQCNIYHAIKKNATRVQ